MSSPSGPTARLRVGVIGAGRVGVALGAALARAGHLPVAVTAVSDASLARAEAMLPGVPIREALDVVAEADLLLLAVPDDVLPGLVAGLAAADAFHPGQVLLHTSARHGIGVLEPAAPHDVLPVAIHPAVALMGDSGDAERLSAALFAVTTVKSLRPLGEALVIEMGGEPVWVEEEDRPAYAAALGAVRDGLEGVLGAAARVLADCGVANPARALGPLVLTALEDALRTGSVADDPGTHAAPVVDRPVDGPEPLEDQQ